MIRLFARHPCSLCHQLHLQCGLLTLGWARDCHRRCLPSLSAGNHPDCSCAGRRIHGHWKCAGKGQKPCIKIACMGHAWAPGSCLEIQFGTEIHVCCDSNQVPATFMCMSSSVAGKTTSTTWIVGVLDAAGGGSYKMAQASPMQ